MKTWSWLALAAFVACSADSSLDGVSQESHGHHERAKVFSPDAHPFGRSMVHWSQRWWKWIFSIPAPQNPFLDPTGEDCAVGQDGPVWASTRANERDPGRRAPGWSRPSRISNAIVWTSCKNSGVPLAGSSDRWKSRPFIPERVPPP